MECLKTFLVTSTRYTRGKLKEVNRLIDVKCAREKDHLGVCKSKEGWLDRGRERESNGPVCGL